ncbi:MAG TPA: uracil phosphoribosyltransferase, partial [Anaerolineaceae bacterium]|nr:uracil phosphoribosyltransferase [Anaerolineaceae bacterium]
MENVFASSHPLIATKLTFLRNVTTEPKKFRELVRELAAMLTYEATADLAVKTVSVQTPLVETEGVK